MTAMTSTFDLVILGAGSGGYACALRAAQLGMSVALIEQDLVGGTCLHRGCIPTKAILHAAEVADSARDAAQFGVHATVQGIDLAAVNRYSASVVARLYKGLTGLVNGRRITVVHGAGRLERSDSETVVAVDQARYRGRHTVLATGASARSLPGLEVDGQRVLTSEHALRLERLPSSAIVLGGGVIGVEFASAWRSFGVEVSVVEALPRLVSGEEPEISQGLQRAFRKRSIPVLTGRPMKSVDVTGPGVRMTLADDTLLEADLVLVAVGRGPNTNGLGYAEAGLAMEGGFVAVNERLETSLPGVRAVGDIVAGPQLAHRGFAHGIFVAEDIAAAENQTTMPAPVLDDQIPKVTYSDPEIASVGLGEDAARARYGDVTTLTYDLAGNGRSQILKTQGFVKLVRRTGGPVVGVHMIGARVSELVAEAQLITTWDAHPSDVAGLLHAHPTQGEALGEAHLALAGKPLHSHG